MRQYNNTKLTSGKFIQTSHILENVILKNFSKRGFGDSSLLFRWNDIVGQEIGQITRPLRVNFSKENQAAILKLQVNGAFAPQIALSLDKIMVKVNSFFGYKAISKIVLKQNGPYNLNTMAKI